MKINCPNALVEEPPAPGDPEITRSDGGQVDLARGSHGCRARYPELRIEFLRNMIGVATEKLSGVSGKSALRLAHLDGYRDAIGKHNWNDRAPDSKATNRQLFFMLASHGGKSHAAVLNRPTFEHFEALHR